MSSPPLLMTMIQAAPADGQPSGLAALMFQTVPFLFIGLIIYWFMFRPQQVQMKAHRETIAAVKKGDEVVTAGGIRGRVTKVSDEDAEVEIASGVKVRVIKSTIAQVLPTGKPAND
ncbi:preprotein translocase subunit YajC [Sphingomonas sp.]|uniref:preprotein translocase subunit YajC n=1 Tax=Sphingomonas sp. TaxID=28214 RepID=UPI0025F6457A|nr:preprotein translocase subunit YajC [Sphingomonas sp.]